MAGTATETADYTISGKTLTLPAGAGTRVSRVTARLTGVDDNLDDDDEIIEITGSRNGLALGSPLRVAIEDDDWPELTVTFRQADYRVAEGAHVDLPVTLSAVPERQVTIPIEFDGADGAEAVDYSVSPASLTFGASETDKTVRVSASNDSAVDPGESVELSFGTTLPQRISEGGIAEVTVAIQDTDFTFAPAFAAGPGTTESDADTYTVSENSSALRLSLSLETPRGVRVADIVDPVVVTLATRENAGSKGVDEDYATQRRSGTFGDFGEFDRDLSFAPGDFSYDSTCGCARAEKAVSVDLFNDRVHERVEVFGLRLSRKSARLSVPSHDVTVRIEEDDAEPVLTLGVDPGMIAEAGGTSTVTVSTGSGSTFPAAQAIRLDLSGTATQGTDYTIGGKTLTLPAGLGTSASMVTATLTGVDDNLDDDDETIEITGSRDGAAFGSRQTIAIEDDDAAPSLVLSVSASMIDEDGETATVTVSTGSGSTYATDQTVRLAVAGTATETADYTVSGKTLTLPAGAGTTASMVTATLTGVDDNLDDDDETIEITGSRDGAAFGSRQTIAIEDDDAAPSLALSVSASTIDEDGGTATVTVSTGSGSTYATAQTVRLAVAGTATETADYTISGKTLTLPAGAGTSASMVTATVTALDDNLDDDDETIEITGSRDGVAFGSRQTIAIEDDDWPELTVTFRQADYRVAEGAHVDLPVTLSAVPERRVTIPIEFDGAGGAEAIDYSVSPASLTFGASETDKTVRVSASNDSAVDPGERVALSFGTPLPERISEGGIAEATVAIRDTDFTFAPAFAAGPGTTESDTDVYTASEDSSALRLSLSLETPRGARVADIVDPVVVTLATRENAGSKGVDEDYASQRRAGTFGDYGALNRDLSFAPGDFSDDGACGCARAEKAVSVDLFDDRVRERVEVFGLRLSRKSGRLSVSSEDITAKIAEDDAEPALTLDANPIGIAEAGGASTVTVGTGSGSTFPAAQAIRLDLTGTATRGADYTIDATSLTLPAGTGRDPSSVTTTVRAQDDPIDDDGETVVLAASRDAVEFARRTVFINDDDIGSTSVDLAVNPAQVREDAGATTVRVTATLDAAARAEDTDVAVTVGASGDSAVEGTDYETVADLTLTIDAGETSAETTFRLEPTNNDAVEGAKTITVDGSASGPRRALGRSDPERRRRGVDDSDADAGPPRGPRERGQPRGAGDRDAGRRGAHDGDGRDGEGRIGGGLGAGGHGLRRSPRAGADDPAEPDGWDGDVHVAADERPNRRRDGDDLRERRRRGADGRANRACARRRRYGVDAAGPVAGSVEGIGSGDADGGAGDRFARCRGADDGLGGDGDRGRARRFRDGRFGLRERAGAGIHRAGERDHRTDDVHAESRERCDRRRRGNDLGHRPGERPDGAAGRPDSFRQRRGVDASSRCHC